MPNRDSSIDAYKLFCMWGIAFLHASGHVCHHPTQWLANMFYWCVPGFVFITGWFGIDFSIRKLLKLYGIALYVVIVIQIIRKVMGFQFDIVYAVRMFRDFWFLNAYAALMMLAPALNKLTIVDNGGGYDRKTLWPISLLVFGWAFFATIPMVQSVTPISAGIREGSVIMMMGVYIVGRLFRGLKLDERLSCSQIAIILCLSLVMAAAGLCSYTSPFSLGIAICVFIAFRRTPACATLGRCFAWMLPSVFSIYLFHSRGMFGLEIMTQWESALLDKGVPLGIVYLVVATVVFFSGIALDIPRRLVAFLLSCCKCASGCKIRREKV